MARLRNPSGATSITELENKRWGEKEKMPNRKEKKSENLIHCPLPAFGRK